MGVGSRTRFQISVNCSKLKLPPKRLARWRYQSRGEIRPSCQSCQRGSFSMADHSSEGEREPPAARPCIAPVTSILTRTRPISKIIARRLAGDIGYLVSAPGMETCGGEPADLDCRLARRMLMIAGRSERTMTTAIT